MTEQLSDKSAAQAYRSIRAILPELIHRGALSVLEATAPTEGSGLSWANVPADELSKMDSESARLERLRRSVTALEQWNLKFGLSEAYAPTAKILSSLAGTGEGTAQQWLARPSVRTEIERYLKRLWLDGASAQKLADFNRLKPNGDPKPDARSLISWEAI